MASPSVPKQLADAPFLAACRCEPTRWTPVWFMRQAGRSLPEYRVKRGSMNILEAVRHPDLAVELTLQPVRRYGVDAAILFSDIVVPVAALGFGVDIYPGVGPVVEHPFRSRDDLARLRPLEPEDDISYVLEAVSMLVRELDVPLIGFAGAPFTVASYLVEGRPSRTYAATKSLMYKDPNTWAALVDRLADVALASLRAQVAAGAQAVQLFDSWAGALSPADYRRYVAPASTKVLAGLADLGVPRIHFGVDTGSLLGLMAETGTDVIGVDWRVTLHHARRQVGPTVAVQGNLDPVICLADWPLIAAQTKRLLHEVGGQPGHIFNLGHGVLPETDPNVLTRLVEFVHKETEAS